VTSLRAGSLRALVVFLALLAPATAAAHTRVAGSNPKPNATLAKAPKAVAVWFTARIPGGSLTVLTGDGRVATRTPGGRDPRNPRALVAKLRPGLGAGRYLLTWKVVSADGHSLTGTIPFRVR
jgi:copper transport protein